jgi:hypothetical protein
VSFPCRVDGRPAVAAVEADHLVVGDAALPWVDVDEVVVENARVTLGLADGGRVVLSHLARRTDEFVEALRTARARARRAALLQWTAAPPIDTYPTRVGGEPGQVVLFPDGVTVEPLNGPPRLAPLSLVEEVERDGYRIVLHLRGTAPVAVPPLARRTDEFLLDLDRARRDLAARTAAAYAALSPALAGFPAPDGWAVDAAVAGTWWPHLRAAVAGGGAADDGDGDPGDPGAAALEVLEALAGDRLRLGIKLQGDGALRFALAPHGDRVAVEGLGDDARATYVFRTASVDELNAVLLLTSFRREALHLPPERLGRWAVAVRTLEVVRRARAALVARVVHTDGWASAVEAALRG